MKQKATWFLLLSTSLLLGSCSWFNNAEDIYDESEASSSEQVSSSTSIVRVMKHQKIRNPVSRVQQQKVSQMMKQVKVLPQKWRQL